MADTTGPILQYDNVRGAVKSGCLEGLLTSAVWDARRLGKNDQQLRLTNDRLPVFSGNAMSFGGDMHRRVFQANIDANMDQPWLRTGYKLKLPQWAIDNRARIVHALLAIARAWVVAGMPAQEADRTDDYGDYTAGIRGLLTFAGFAGNFNDSCTRTEPIGADDAELSDLLVGLYGVFGADMFTVKDVVSRLGRGPLADVLPEDLAVSWDRSNGSTASFSRTLGKWLHKRDGRFAHGLKVVGAGKDSHTKADRYKIVDNGLR